MLAFHVENNAQLTIGCIDVPIADAVNFGVMKIDEQNRITDFVEKPEAPFSISGDNRSALVSTGIYIFDTEFLIDELIADADSLQSQHDFGHDIIPRVISSHRVYAYPFHDTKDNKRAYWRDVGTVDSYWKANMELIDVTPELNLYDHQWPVWTYLEQAPPAKFIFNDEDRRGIAIDSLISDGCIVSGASIKHSLLFSNVRVNAGSVVTDSVVLPDVTIGENCKINKAIIDKGAVIPDGSIVGESQENDALKFHVTEEGVVLVTPDMLGQKIHVSR